MGFPDGGGERRLGAPPLSFVSGAERLRGNSSDFSPLRKAMRFIVQCEQDVSAFISRLLFASGPSAVLGGIALGVVGALYLQALLVGWEHVLNEFVWVVFPFFADGYATASVVVVAFILGVVASSYHVGPNQKDGVPPCSVLGGAFVAETTTTPCRSAGTPFWCAEGVNSYVNRITSAVALAFCEISTRLRSVGGQNSETTVFRVQFDMRRRPSDEFHVIPPVGSVFTLSHEAG